MGNRTTSIAIWNDGYFGRALSHAHSYFDDATTTGSGYAFSDNEGQ